MIETAYPNGFYQVESPLTGKEYKFRLRTTKISAWPQKGKIDAQELVLELQNGNVLELAIMDGRELTHRTNIHNGEGLWAAVDKLLAGDLEEAGRLYAQTTVRCYVCGRKLTNKKSKETGIGPECAGNRNNKEEKA